MAKEEKVRAVEQLAEMLDRSSLVVLTDYRGLKVADMASLRRKLRDQGVEYHVAKNTLLGFAAEKTGRAALKELLVGPTAIALGTGDVSVMARTLGEYERTSKVFKVKAGVMGDRILKAQEVATLASLPGREVLLSQVVAGVQSPLAGLVGVLGGLLGGLVGTLEARRMQLEEQQGAAA